MKSVTRFSFGSLLRREQFVLGKKKKLSPWYIGLYEVIKKIEPEAYRLSLPLELSQVHNVFHVSMLKKYRSDPSHVISRQLIELSDDLNYVENRCTL